MVVKSKFSVLSSDSYGPSVLVDDEELADLFDDFLSEKIFVLFNIRDKDSKKEFLFGKAASEENLWKLVDLFLNQYGRLSIR